MKTCNCCHIEKQDADFYKKRTSKDGLFWWCIKCHKNKMRAKYHELAQSKEYREHERARLKKFIQDNPDKVAAASKRYILANPDKMLAKVRAYQLAKAKRTPAWLTDEDLWMMEEAYSLAKLREKLFGFPWEVDHIVPLNGKLVSGFHVPHNLQVVPQRENRSKANRFTIT